MTVDLYVMFMSIDGGVEGVSVRGVDRNWGNGKYWNVFGLKEKEGEKDREIDAELEGLREEETGKVSEK